MEKNYKIFFKCHSFNSIKIKYKFLLQKKKNELMENQRNIFRR